MLIEYFNEKKQLSSLHVSTILKRNEHDNLDEASKLLKYLKIPETLIIDAIYETTGEHYFPVNKMSDSTEVAELNRKLLIKANAIVLKIEDNVAHVAMLEANELTRGKLRQVISVAIKEEKCIKYALMRKIMELNKTLLSKDLYIDDNETNSMDVLDLIIIDAINSDATDIHIETLWDQDLNDFTGVIKFRIRPDMVKWEKQIFTVEEVIQLKSAIYSRATQNSADGNSEEGHTFNHNLNLKNYDFRISVLSFALRRNISSNDDDDMRGTLGYKITIRIQEMLKTILPISELNLGDKAIKTLENMTSVKQGITFITGGTGSGKNTTYAGLVNSMLQENDMAIMEFGNPIEYRLPIVQVQVADYEEMKKRIKSTKTHDPDCIIVTEFRDREMGHLIKDAVISRVYIITTMHIIRGWDFVEKIREYFGESDYKTLLNYTSGICHQVMFRRLCSCRQELTMDKMSARELIAYSALKLNGHKVYTTDPTKSFLGECICYGGYTNQRYPAAEVLHFDRQNKKVRELLDDLNGYDSISTMTDRVKAYMMENKIALEYTIRDRIIAGDIDFRKVVEENIVEEIKEVL